MNTQDILALAFAVCAGVENANVFDFEKEKEEITRAYPQAYIDMTK